MNAVFRLESPRLAQDFSAPAYCGPDARSAIVHDLTTRIIEEDHNKNRVSVVSLHVLNRNLIDSSRPNSGDVQKQFIDNDVETVAAGCARAVFSVAFIAMPHAAGRRPLPSSHAGCRAGS